jgi:hypothetical protein
LYPSASFRGWLRRLWRVVIEGESLGETVFALGLKYGTAYAAANHVAHLVREEGRRRSARLGLFDSSILA